VEEEGERSRGMGREVMGWEGVEELRFKKGGKSFCPPTFKELPPPMVWSEQE